MKRTVPILLTVVCGWLITYSFFAPNLVLGPDGAPVLDARGQPARHVSNAINSELNQWALVLFSVAFLLGIGNLVRINLKQITTGHGDAVYKAILLVSMFGFLGIGLADVHKDRLPDFVLTRFVPADLVTLDDGTQLEGYIVEDDEQGVHVRVLPSLDTRIVQREQIASTVEHSLKLWVYDKIFRPLQGTMFSLLAFFIASAAFRAFRARSLEAILLLSAGAIVMMGQAPLLDAVTGGYASRALAFLMSNINAAGQRAIIIGATLGVLATGLRIILGIERSYLSE